MSIFKIKEWWSTANRESVRELSQSDFLICIDKLWDEDDGDSIIHGDGDRYLRVYKPQGEYDACDLKLEVVLGDDILQITTGKYVTSTDRIQILILHPRSIIVYEIQSRDGHTNIGDQNALTPVLQHDFEKYAYNLICGKFGGVKNRDLICVQSLDGTLNFYDQETRLFNCQLHETIIPGPLAYAKSPDLFVTVNCNWILEIYSYQQLQDAGDTSMRYGGKKLIPEWIYNPGEEMFALQVIQTSNNMSNIICLGERHIYCLQDNGLLRFMKKFDYTPVCFTAYLIGWYYEPGARLIVMVASDDSKLYIYENTTLLWSCDLLSQPIFISRSYFKGLSAGIVTLSTNGDINCCYLGTVPDLKSVPTLKARQNMDVSSAQIELEELEAKINNISQSEGLVNVETKLQIEMEMRELKLNDHDISEYGSDSAYEAICSAVVKIKPHSSTNIVSLQVTLTCDHPFECSEKCKAYETLEEEKVLQVQIYIKKSIPILNNDLTAVLTFVDSSDKISAAVIKKRCCIPLYYYFIPTTPSKEAKLKLTIQFNDSQVGLPELFKDFNHEELSANHCNDHAIAIKPLFDDVPSEITIIRAKSSQRFRIQSQNYFNMVLIIQHIINQVHKQNEHRIDMQCTLVNPILSDFYQIFYTCIENHSHERLKLEKLENELSILQKQFALIQKQLLLKYGTLPPGNCDALEYLLKDTQTRLLVVARNVMDSKETLSRSGYELASAGGLVVVILQLAGVPAETISVLNQTLAFYTLYADYKEWQETVSQSVTHILNTVYGCTNKEKEKIAALTEESILKKNNLKRFMKQLQMLFDKAVTGIQIDINEAPNHNNQPAKF